VAAFLGIGVLAADPVEALAADRTDHAGAARAVTPIDHRRGAHDPDQAHIEIGRASCRESVRHAVDARPFKKDSDQREPKPANKPPDPPYSFASSSRSRHTTLSRDWRADVCSSDL